MESDDIKRNLNYRVGLPYPPNFYVILPAIFTLLGLACFLIYQSRWLLNDVLNGITEMIAGRYRFDPEHFAPLLIVIQLSQRDWIHGRSGRFRGDL